MKTKRGVEVPGDFAKALNGNPGALEAFEAMSPSYQREYCGYVNEVKKQEARERRIQRSIEMILNWGKKRRG